MIRTRIGLLVIVVGIISLFFLNKEKFSKSTEFQNVDGHAEARAKWMRSRLVDPQTGEIPINMRHKELAFGRTLPKAFQNSYGSRDEDSLVYARRGPQNVGGRTRALAVDLSNTSNILAGGVSGGIWRSTNFGLSWAKVSSNDYAQNISCIVQDPRPGKKDIWYAGTGEGRGSLIGNDFTLLGNGLLKSIDKGVTWTPLKSTQVEKVNNAGDWGITWSLAVDPSNTTEDEVYAAANGVIMKSLDGGATWKKVLGENNSSASFYADVKVTSNGVVYAALAKQFNQADPGVYRSTDGETWVNITGAIWPSNFERIVFDIAGSDENELIFLARTPGSGSMADPSSADNEYSSLFKYNYINGDGSGSGGAWTNLSTNIPSNQNAYYSFDTQGNYNMMVKIDPFDKTIVYIGSTNLFRSDDGFTTRNNIVQIGGYNPKPFTDPREYRYANQHPDQHNLIFLPNNSSEAFSASDGGISFTNNIKANEVVWQFKNTGYFTSQFYTVAIDHLVKNAAVIGGLQDNGTFFTNSASDRKDWTDPLQSDGSYCAVEDGTLSDGSGVYYVSSQYGRTFRIRMNGSGEKTASVRLEPTPTNQFNRSINFDFINPFELDYADNNIMYMLYKDAAGGPSKIKVHNSLKSINIDNTNATRNDWSTMNFTFSRSITAMVSSRTNPKHRLYVGTSNGSIYRVENANTAGALVTPISDITGVLKGTYVSDFAVHPEDADKVMVVFSNYNAYSIFYSEDGGDNWKTAAGNLEDELPDGIPDAARGLGNGPSVRSAAILETDSGTAYFVGTSIGLFATDMLDGESTIWSQQSPTLIGNAIVDKMDTRDADNYLAIATHGSGIFGVSVTSSSLIGMEDAKTANNFKVNVYPNPSRGVVHLNWENSIEQLSSFVLYDEIGRVKLEGQINDFEKTLTINASELPSGVYYIEVKGAYSKMTKKLVITK